MLVQDFLLQQTMSSSRTLHLHTNRILSRQLGIIAHLRCLQQQCRSAATSTPQAQTITRPPSSQKPIPIPEKNYKPQPLSRPIGQKSPPEPGQNTGIDTRPWRQRRDDFFNYDKHLVRRRELYVILPMHLGTKTTCFCTSTRSRVDGKPEPKR